MYSYVCDNQITINYKKCPTSSSNLSNIIYVVCVFSMLTKTLKNKIP